MNRKKSLRRFLSKIGGVLSVLLFAGCTNLVFQPDRAVYATPAQYGAAYENVTFASADGTKLDGWWIRPQGEPKGTVLVVHGNARNMSAHFQGFGFLVRSGWEVFIFDYRGYGKSGGEPGMEGAVEDTVAAIRYVLRRRSGSLTVIGQSLGAVLLIDALARTETDRIRLAVFDSAFASLPEAGDDALSGNALTWPFQWLAYLTLDDRYDAIDRVGTLKVPKLFLAGSKDRIVNPNHSWRLFDAASRPRAFWLATEAGHIRALESPALRRHFVAFLSRPVFPADFSEMLIFDKISIIKKSKGPD